MDQNDGTIDQGLSNLPSDYPQAKREHPDWQLGAAPRQDPQAADPPTGYLAWQAIEAPDGTLLDKRTWDLLGEFTSLEDAICFMSRGGPAPSQEAPTDEYDCTVCGLPSRHQSYGGPGICPACDCGQFRDGRKWTYAELMLCRKDSSPDQKAEFQRRARAAAHSPGFRAGTKAYTDLLNLLAERLPAIKSVYDSDEFAELSRVVYAELGGLRAVPSQESTPPQTTQQKGDS